MTMRFRLDHIGVSLDPQTGSFGLHPLGAAGFEEAPRALFTGFVHRGMAAELRRIADAFEPLERKDEDDG